MIAINATSKAPNLVAIFGNGDIGVGARQCTYKGKEYIALLCINIDKTEIGGQFNFDDLLFMDDESKELDNLVLPYITMLFPADDVKSLDVVINKLLEIKEYIKDNIRNKQPHN